MKTTHLLVLVAAAGCGDAAVTQDASVADAAPCSPQPVMVANSGWQHVISGTQLTYANNPPASGQHYPSWARYQKFTTAIPRGNWIHNLEHGAIVLLHRPDAPAALVAELVAAYDAIPVDAGCGHRRALLTPDPELDVPVAAVAANWVLESSCVSPEAILAFVAAHRGMGPENVCAEGSVP